MPVNQVVLGRGRVSLSRPVHCADHADLRPDPPDHSGECYTCRSAKQMINQGERKIFDPLSPSCRQVIKMAHDNKLMVIIDL